MGADGTSETGTTTIARWRDGKASAVTLAFDDSLWSHVDYVIPLLARNGLVGSFWVNPATSRYGYGIEMWEGGAQALGMEMCAHTMNHTGASSYDEAEWEIGESARIVRAVNPPGAGKPFLFLRGGATTWKIPNDQIAAIVQKYGLVRGRGGGVDHGGDGKTGRELVGFVKEAEADGGIHCIAFHGVGSHAEWLTATAEAFEELAAYLRRNRDRVWNGTCGEVFKYVHERDSARVTVVASSGDEIRLDLSCADDPGYYDAPLTLETRVPKEWKRCLVTQRGGECVRRASDGVVRYGALPNSGQIVLTGTARRETPAPARPPAPARRKIAWVGNPLLAVDRIGPGEPVARELPPGLKDVCIGFTFRLTRDFSLPEYAKGGGNALSLLAVSDESGRELAAVRVYRHGKELSLYALLQDNVDWQGLPGWPEIDSGHLGLKAGRDHSVMLRLRAGCRDGGAELWLDGRLVCSFMRRDTTGRAAKGIVAGVSGRPEGMKGSIAVGELRVTGE